MNNFKMTLQYDGTRYLGWTKNEKSVKTVSYKLEQVLTRLLGQPVTLHAAVRTEPCVHASCQVCSFVETLPMYIPGRFRTASRPSNTAILPASYVLFPAITLSPSFSNSNCSIQSINKYDII